MAASQCCRPHCWQPAPKPPGYGREEGESKAYVEVSSQKVIFDADGGNAVITVATNADGWDYAAEGDWFTVARQDGNALLVETLINAGAEP